jgi:hypothetical protein
MPKKDFISHQDALFDQQMQTFKSNITGYVATLGLTTTQVSDQAADADYFHQLLANHDLMRNDARQWTNYKNFLRTGTGIIVPGEPAAPVFATTVAAVAPGIEPRFRDLAAIVRANPNANQPMLLALGLEGAEETGPDMGTIQPNFKVTVSGGAVQIGWSWQGQSAFLDMIRLEVDRGDGKGFVLLAMDTTPGYTDTMAFPAAPAKWTYRGIYCVGDSEVGQWSNPTSVMVG